MIDDIMNEIGVIRKAIIKSKREINNVMNNIDRQRYTDNISKLLNIINKVDINSKELTIILDIYQVIKDSNDYQIGMELLETLDTINIESVAGFETNHAMIIEAGLIHDQT